MSHMLYVGMNDRYFRCIEIEAKVSYGIKTEQDTFLGLQLDGGYTRLLHKGY